MEGRGFSDLLSTASSFLSSQSQTSGHPSHSPAPSSDTPPTSAGQNSGTYSYGDVMSSAQVIMNAAESKFHTGGADSGEQIDMGNLAGAASGLVGAAVHYGNLDNTPYGEYAQKAEGYLQSYEGKNAHPNVPAGSAASQGHSQGYPSQGYGESAQGSGPAGS